MTARFILRTAMLVAGISIIGAMTATAAPLNGMSDFGTDDHGNYYAVTGGIFPTGATPNGDNASGGTFRFLVDNAADWGRNPAESGVWQKDDWFSDNAGIGLTLRNNGAIIYDNNGLEPDSTLGANITYYDYYLGSYPTGGHGAHVAYSMSNNRDWIYAGYFKVESETFVSSITGYFVYSSDPNDPLTAGFNPSNPAVRFRMNIWSDVGNNVLLPTDSGSFDGDVFSSDSVPGTFTFSDTGYNRVGSSSTQDIYRLIYTFDTPMILDQGEYWFSHDATIVPEPSSGLMLVGVASLLIASRGRRGKSSS